MQVCETDGDWQKKAKELSIQPVSIACSRVKIGDRKDNRGGKRYFKITDEDRDHIIKIIEGNSTVTLGEIVWGIQQKFGLTFCKSTT